MVILIKDNLKDVQGLKQCENEVWINNPDYLDDDKKQIQRYKKNNKEYRILIDFLNYSTSIDQKMKVMNMISEMDCNNKVGGITIAIDSNNRWNEEILRTIMRRYQNIYKVWIIDSNVQVDNRIHRVI